MRWMALTAVVLALAPVIPTRSARAQEARLAGGLSALEGWLGTWQIGAEWAGGGTLWAQSDYRPLLGGAFLEGRVFVRENGGELYQRYRTLLGWDEARGMVIAHTFNHDGTVTTAPLIRDGRAVTTSWAMADSTIDERTELTADGAAMHWLVWRTPANGPRSQIMNGTWRRVESQPIELPADDGLSDDLAALAPLLGGWETAGDPRSGEPAWLRTEYRRGLGGRFVDTTTWLIDADDVWTRVSEAVLTAAPDADRLELVRFASDGAVTTATMEVAHGTAGTGLVMESQPATGPALRELVSLSSPDSYRRQAWLRTPGSTEWTADNDARWLRQGAAAGVRAAIDPTRFVAAGEGIRSFVKEAYIPAPSAAVWAAWTEPEAWRRLWGPQSQGRFDLAVGGAYEWLFDGSIGGNGDQVLSYIPGRMLSFSWNAPPSQPVTRLARTWVVVELEPVEANATRVRLTHLGFGDGPQWDETYAYFDHAWERVLALMAARLAPEEPTSGE